MAPWCLETLLFVLCWFLQRINGNIVISASPSTTVNQGAPLQIVCHINTEDTPPSEQCSVTWSRTYFPGREWREERLEGRSLDQPRYYTTTDSQGRPLSSSVHIPQMKDLYRGTYMCKLICGDRESSASISIDILTVPITLGATVGTLVAFLVITVILLLAFFVGCRQCCIRRSQTRLSHSAESLLRQQRESEEDLAPPRYSVVVSVQGEGAEFESSLAEENSSRPIGGILVLQPPSYDEALRDLAARGIKINIDKLKPMPPAYGEIPYTIPSSDSPALLELQHDSIGGNPA